jgi:tetratricopeptide (TPR) repeat protein
MNGMAGTTQIREWSEEIAQHPGSLAYFPLSEAYHREGRGDAALRLCIRGLERHPEHVEGHFLLSQLYRDRGERVKADDELAIALRLDPEHLPSLRTLAEALSEEGDWRNVWRHTETALRLSPGDEMLERLHTRALDELGRADPGGAPGDDVDDLEREFTRVTARTGMAGAMLLDAQGYVLAGGIDAAGRDRASDLAAALQGAADDAGRALEHLEFGGLKGVLVETPSAILHLRPAGDGLLAVAAGGEVPPGRVIRAASRLLDSALRVLGPESARE